MNNHSKKTKLTALIMLLTLLLTLFSACADTVTTYTAEMPTVESVVGYSIESTPSDESIIKLSDTWNGTMATYFAGGSGSSDDPYQIETAEQLALLASIINTADTTVGVDNKFTVVSDGTEVTVATLRAAHYKLTADIVLNDTSSVDWTDSDSVASWASGAGLNEWTPIGSSSSLFFKGTFDGGNHTISGLYINNTTSHYQGLFGYVKTEVGGTTATVKNVNVSGSVTSSKWWTSGVVGILYGSGAVENCSFSGSVTGNYIVGGVVGGNDGTVSNCYNTGTVTGTDASVGGVVGHNYEGTVTNCYNTGDVTGTTYVGGVVGENSGTVSNCYAYNGITVTNSSGGTTPITTANLIGSGSATSNVTTFDGSGNLAETLTGDSYESCKTLLSALNAYVATTNETNGDDDLSTWYDGYVYGVGEASAAFEEVEEPVVPPTAETQEEKSIDRDPLDQSAPIITVDGEIATVYDQNLASITINGEEIEITDTTMTIDLAEYGNGEHQITATDKYRRTTTETVTVSGEEQQTETVVPTVTTTPVATQTPTATVAPEIQAETTATNSGYTVWIILGIIAIAVISVIIYKKKK